MRGFWLELLWFVVSVGAFGAFVWGMAWGYPLGRDTIWTIGGVAVLIVAAMGVHALVRAWQAGVA
ncbi:MULTISPECIES: hypothetical protein [unclassified Sphingomonas]|uniref:hypothetical protein n=1 Tax=unclassified Sphingomonas TaxID=196159 RepID=UPI001F58864A|nr:MULTISPECIES: hypothetical protein [unclassified Sphingomonas]